MGAGLSDRERQERVELGKICGLSERGKGAFVSQDSGGSCNKRQPGRVKVNTETHLEYGAAQR